MVIDETLIEATKETQADAKTSIPISSLAEGDETKRVRVFLSDTLKRLKERPRCPARNPITQQERVKKERLAPSGTPQAS